MDPMFNHFWYSADTSTDHWSTSCHVLHHRQGRGLRIRAESRHVECLDHIGDVATRAQQLDRAEKSSLRDPLFEETPLGSLAGDQDLYSRELADQHRGCVDQYVE